MAIQQQTELSVTEALMQKADLNAKLRAGDDVDVKAAQ
jgi:capsular polysaccharide biosynthesis protein